MLKLKSIFKSPRDLYVGLAFGLVAVFISALPSWTTFTAMDGWSFFPLGDHHLYPYRDYFYPVPPLTYWWAQLSSWFDNPLVASRVLLLHLSVLLYWSTWKFARLFIKPWQAGLVGLAVCAITTDLRLEPYLGWNTQFLSYQTAGALLLLSVVVRIMRNKISRNKVIAYSAVAGLAFGAATLAKHTALVFVLSVLVVTALLWWRSQPNEKNYFRLLNLSVLLALVTSALGLFVDLLLHNAVPQFLDGMLSGGGKNPDGVKGIALMLQSLDARFASLLGLFLFVSVTFLITISELRAQKTVIAPTSKGMDKSKILLFIFLVTLLLVTLRSDNLSAIWVVVPVAAYFTQLAEGKFGSLRTRVTYIVTFAVVAALGLFKTPDIFSTPLALKNWIVDLNGFTHQGSSVIIAFMAILTLWLVLTRKKRRESLNSSVPLLNSPTSETRILVHFAIAIFVGNLINYFSSGGSVYLQWWTSLVAILYVLAQKFLASRVSPNSGFFLDFPISFATALTILTIILNPYSWFGWVEKPIEITKLQVSNTGYISGLPLMPKSVNFYNRVADAERKALAMSHSQSSGVFTFPNIPATAAVGVGNPYRGLNCFVQWYDVCPNKLAGRDLRHFKANLPSVVVWADLDPVLLQGHETVFVRGISNLRYWQSFKESQVKSGNWKIVRSLPVTEQSPNTQVINVYSVVKVP